MIQSDDFSNFNNYSRLNRNKVVVSHNLSAAGPEYRGKRYDKYYNKRGNQCLQFEFSHRCFLPMILKIPANCIIRCTLFSKPAIEYKSATARMLYLLNVSLLRTNRCLQPASRVIRANCSLQEKSYSYGYWQTHSDCTVCKEALSGHRPNTSRCLRNSNPVQ